MINILINLNKYKKIKVWYYKRMEKIFWFSKRNRIILTIIGE